MTKRTNKAGTVKARALVALDAVPAENQPRALLLRNGSPEVLIVKSENATAADVVLGLQAEVVVSEEWARNRGLRSLIAVEKITWTWVDPLHEPRELPRIENAPMEIVPDQSYEREYARQIAFRSEPEAQAAIGVMVRLPNTGEIDIRYMKEIFRRVLELAKWLEERIQNRSKILRALDRRIDEIRAL